jgi:phosphatidate cytidylyltransferase
VNDKNRNLLARAVSAVLLLPVVLWLTWQGGLGFALLVAVGAGLAALELNRLPAIGAAARSGATTLPGSAGGLRALTGAAVASAAVSFLLPLLEDRPSPLLSLESLFTALVLASLCDALFFEQDLSLAPRRVGLAILGPVWCGLPLAAIVELRQLPHGAVWVLVALSLSFGNDTGAYFAGRAFGRRKLFPRISPSKTWEGAIGGSIASTLLACLFGGLWLPELPLWGAALVGLGGSILGPLGDLSESLFKRAYGAKDSGRIMPGHGGMFDRIDALLFISPFVLFCARHFTR